MATLALLPQPQNLGMAGKPSRQQRRFLLPRGLVAVSAYDGYWGAGAGVMTLALLMITIGQGLTPSNALKNMLLGIADVTCCAAFVLFWTMGWAAAAPVAAGVLAGSTQPPARTPHGAHGPRHAALARLELAICRVGAYREP